MTTKDPREFIRVHNAMPTHPKIMPLSDAGFRLLIESWAYCSLHRTDGLIAAKVWKRCGTPRARKELLEAGLVLDAFEDGVRMHDYEQHQLTRADIDTLTARNSHKTSIAAHMRWHVQRGMVEASCEHCTSNAKPMRARMQDASADASVDAMPTQCQEEEEEEEAKNSPSAAPRRPILTKQLEGPFEAFWTAYPRKVGKLGAQRAFVAAVKIVDPQVIVTGAVRFAAASRSEDPKFVPHPVTWLHQGRWDDQPAAPAKPAPIGGGW